MHSTSRIRWAVLMMTILFSGIGVFGSEADDYIPEVTDRVARISFVQGDVQIRREDNPDWEVAVLNLPIVEGDEIATDGNGRLEIQFNSYTHLRIAENSQVKFVGLKDGGIALSVSLGTIVIKASEFDAARAYFEVDAPKTTVAIQRSGIYRIDAGVPDSLEVIISATGGGEARVYSADAGFTLKDGRRAKVYIGGSQTGEWETAQAERFSDEFDSWSIDRDEYIAERLRNAHYDRYYDRDIYGAEDLNDYGEWIHTKTYGYVWRPYQNSVSQYSGWSPYRYGQWRWVPQYGWSWVNDEPWGWATYHHGRWVWDNGSWLWTPYGYYRSSRSWWHPALVVLRVIGGVVCWYPLPYNYGYYNYNSYYYSHHRPRHNWNNGNNHGGWNGPGNPNPTAIVNGVKSGTPANPTVTPTPMVVLPGVKPGTPNDVTKFKTNVPPLDNVPPGGVITVAASEFGRTKGNYGTPPLSVAKTILSSAPDDKQSPPILPTYGELNGKVSEQIRVVRPMPVRAASVPTGATVRTADTPLDQELRKSRIFGGRPPLQINTSQGEIKTVTSGDADTRKTGAVERPAITPGDREQAPIRQAPPTRDTPVYVPPTTRQNDDQQEAPVKIRRSDPPIQRDPPVKTPRYDPPVRSEPPPRYDPPTRSDPPPTKSEPPPRNDPPATKSEPPATKSDPKPDSPSPRKKDGR